MFSVLAVDLDDTLVRTDGTVSPRTLACLQQWVDAGNRLVIATGRSPRRTRDIPPELHGFPWVCYNGAMIFEAGEVVQRYEMTAADVAGVMDRFVAAAPDAWIALECNDHCTFACETEPKRLRDGTTFVTDIRTAIKEPAAKVSLPLDRYRAVEAQLGPLPAGMQLLATEKYNLAQLMPAGISKLAGLSVLAERWRIGLDEFMAFGDDVNDMEMIQETGLGVAMGNAVPELKAAAQRVALTNDEDGIAVLVEELMGLPQPGV